MHTYMHTHTGTHTHHTRTYMHIHTGTHTLAHVTHTHMCTYMHTHTGTHGAVSFFAQSESSGVGLHLPFFSAAEGGDGDITALLCPFPGILPCWLLPAALAPAL